jgi:hypothetical protein
VNSSGPMALTSIFANWPRRPQDAPEGSAASGKTLGEVARLSPDEQTTNMRTLGGGFAPVLEVRTPLEGS